MMTYTTQRPSKAVVQIFKLKSLLIHFESYSRCPKKLSGDIITC